MGICSSSDSKSTSSSKARIYDQSTQQTGGASPAAAAGFTGVNPGMASRSPPPASAPPPHEPDPTWNPNAPGEVPKKYVRVDGIMKVNPNYVQFMISQTGAAAKPSALSPQALPVASTMEDVMAMSEASTAAGYDPVPMSDQTEATVDRMQDPAICQAVGVPSDQIIDDIGAVFARYEIPIGLLNKMYGLTEYEFIEFIIDDSGSMSLDTDSTDPRTGRPLSRWIEARNVVKVMLEVLAHVPTPPMAIVFLNRSDVLSFQHKGEDPKQWLQQACSQIDTVFNRGPTGGTPAWERLRQSFDMHRGRRVIRYFFGDGVPNGGERAIKEIVNMISRREDPQGNPLTFMSCTNEDAAVEWMKECEEVATFCSECDDFNDEAREVLKDQGAILPYTQGFHLINRLVAAMNPDDLDSMDESVPFSKYTLDNLMGVQSTEAEYQMYFDGFGLAQKQRALLTKLDRVKAGHDWRPVFKELASVKGPAKQLPAVQAFKKVMQSTHG